MSFLDNSNSEFLSARITQKGRNTIAKGSFNISYFQVGDSEFDYTSPFTGFTGLSSKPYQRVMSPFDKESGVKYPYNIDTTDTTTTYGVPVQNSTTQTIRNVMGPAGFVSNHIEYDSNAATGTTIECNSNTILVSSIDGSSYINVTSSNDYQNCEYITLVFGNFGGTDPNFPVITGNSNSYIYKITGITGNTLYLDRNTPNLSTLSGNAQVVCNKCELEFPIDSNVADVCLPSPTDPMSQLNPWTLNVVWGEKPIGADVNGTDENLTGYTSNTFVSTKEFLGYTSTGQTFTTFSGQTITKPTSYINSFNEKIEVTPQEQRTIAIIHYSELGDIRNDPERFFKYDDYISYNTSIGDSIVEDNDNVSITDTEYFEVFIPFINYHRNTGTTLGALFMMGNEDYYIKSTKNEKHQLMFRYLIDEQGNNVGKVFPKNKIVVFDDQELVAILDYRSNRRYTLPAPKVGVINSDTTESNSLLTGTTGQTVWVTYMFEYTGDTKLNGIPCNYFSKVTGTTTPSQVTLKFSGNTFSNMFTSLSGVFSGFVANKFDILVQWDNTGLKTPKHDLWKIIDFTSLISGHTVGTLIDPTKLRNYTFTITRSQYENASFFDIENYMNLGGNYLGDTNSTTQPQFGDKQPFPGSVRLVRASDIEHLKFLVNLPSTQFTETQNPTYVSGADKKITEIALLDDNKEVLVISKAATPISRIGTQVFAIKLDF
jgi:hypothetical protein